MCSITPVLLLLVALPSILTSPVPCISDSQFQCENGECIDKDRKCDGVPNCSDNSDEGPICMCLGDTIDKDEFFKCPTKGEDPEDSVCIFKNQQCDGIIDCPFGEDEENCGGENREMVLIKNQINN